MRVIKKAENIELFRKAYSPSISTIGCYCDSKQCCTQCPKVLK